MPRALYNPGAATHFNPKGSGNQYIQINNYGNGTSTCQSFTQSQWDAYSRRYGGLSMHPMYYQGGGGCCHHHCHGNEVPDWMKYGSLGLGVLNGLKDLFKPSGNDDMCNPS
jgi:hypothetical protein